MNNDGVFDGILVGFTSRGSLLNLFSWPVSSAEAEQTAKELITKKFDSKMHAMIENLVTFLSDDAKCSIPAPCTLHLSRLIHHWVVSAGDYP